MTTGAVGRLRSSLPEGTAVVGAGLFVGGASAYVFFKIGQLALGQDGFKPIVALWFVVFTLAPGFLLPIEQEARRAIAHRRAGRCRRIGAVGGRHDPHHALRLLIAG